MNEPNNSKIINNYETKNLNKATYLCLNGAVYIGCRMDEPPIATIILNNVNIRYRDMFWRDTVTVELWMFIRMRKYIKEKIHTKLLSKKQHKLVQNIYK